MALSAPRVPAVRCLAIQGLPGGIRQDADAVGVLVGTAATYLGYAIFRDAFAHEFDLNLGELDALALQTFDQMLEGLAPDITPSKGNRP
ncbi:hypothetical protein [Flexivirga alba]|uniref:Uncharacterized protein n=1 Tax=Flexivirga alba TaxID=702742 RepID=A0ABW2ABM0_9MICO